MSSISLLVLLPAALFVCCQVEIGAFRTYPEGYKPPDEGPSEYQTIPLSKIEDFGVHAKQVRSRAPSPWMGFVLAAPTVAWHPTTLCYVMQGRRQRSLSL